MAASDDKVITVQSVNPPPVPAAAGSPVRSAARFSENLLARLGGLLGHAIEDASSLEVKTFTSAATDTALATNGDPLLQGTRLRAFTRVSLDGDTQSCVPLRENGTPDEALWKIHSDLVTQARADRAATIALAVTAVQKLTRALR
jgi:hypothetical protein